MTNGLYNVLANPKDFDELSENGYSFGKICTTTYTEEIRKKYSESSKGSRNGMFGKRAMNNGLINIMVKIDDIDKYKKLGYILGKISRTKNKR